MTISTTDLTHLRRCVELATEALEDGDEPFGSILVDANGSVRFEDRNRVKDGDETRHPEFEIATWSSTHLTADERRTATVYTSG
jgi:tRNA(Arg) A34 adenosine deaminase TadA